NSVSWEMHLNKKSENGAPTTSLKTPAWNPGSNHRSPNSPNSPEQEEPMNPTTWASWPLNLKRFELAFRRAHHHSRVNLDTRAEPAEVHDGMRQINKAWTTNEDIGDVSAAFDDILNYRGDEWLNGKVEPRAIAASRRYRIQQRRSTRRKPRPSQRRPQAAG